MPTTDDDWDGDDEDWYDDDGDESDDDAPANCPECGAPIHSIAEMCPSCGHWLTEHERGQIWTREAKPAWLKVTAAIVLAAMLAGLLAVAWTVF